MLMSMRANWSSGVEEGVAKLKVPLLAFRSSSLSLRTTFSALRSAGFFGGPGGMQFVHVVADGRDGLVETDVDELDFRDRFHGAAKVFLPLRGGEADDAIGGGLLLGADETGGRAEQQDRNKQKLAN